MTVIKHLLPYATVECMSQEPVQLLGPQDVVVSDSQADPSTSEDPIRKCTHLKRAVRVPSMKRAFKKGVVEKCGSCHDSEEKEIWVCITCGLTLCGRVSAGHAEDHYNAEKHAIVFSIDQGAAWCYECDGWVVPSNTRNRSLYEVKSAVDKQFRKNAKQDILEIYPENENKDKKNRVKVITPGLENLGNTCYFNSTIQVLAVCAPLHDFISRNQFISLSSPPQISFASPVTSAFTSLLRIIYTSKFPESIRPQPLLSRIAQRIPGFHVNDQQDAQELLRHLLEALSEENAPKQDSSVKRSRLKRRRTITNADDIADQGNVGRIRSWLEEIFYGQLASIVVCDECKSVSTSYEDFGELSLPIHVPSANVLSRKRDKLRLFVSSTRAFRSRTSTPVQSDSERSPRVSVDSEPVALKPISEERSEFIKNLLEEKGDAGKIGVEECLKNFFAVETLDGENMFACEECGKISLSKEKPGSLEETDTTVEEKEPKDVEMKSPRITQQLSEIARSETDPESESDYQPSDNEMKYSISAEMDPDHLRQREMLPSKPLSEQDSTGTIPSTQSNQEQPKTVPRKAYKRFLLSSLPLVFIVHLKRFEHSTRSFRKISDAVNFSETLDISPYVLNVKGGAEYKLVGVVVHMGNLSSGHYVSYMLTRKVLDEGEIGEGEEPGHETREWVYASDTSVRYAGKEEVLKASKGVYLLFYEKC
ncbi:Ubiquitin carboxyl-terminal hydrolase 45 [Neolecta irregularis DAH-3]|uniref:Ubiquitin carboxyl-terminal hydrolase n=1 Tax=Neolecta irregularis (strain DAH-3) TaxID=1198029 RepID=A0A1U7LTX9_NEOID|nr:Ubiquitin carboxyl-terminal hydrolase 45 [Neolecta irregularis DAH-3]|eukprot:OLL25971.1 Ubiquitin carboxyl-terminal hydrolase 45 [Neolecta irregularis DAH-3]